MEQFRQIYQLTSGKGSSNRPTAAKKDHPNSNGLGPRLQDALCHPARQEHPKRKQKAKTKPARSPQSKTTPKHQAPPKAKPPLTSKRPQKQNRAQTKNSKRPSTSLFQSGQIMQSGAQPYAHGGTRTCAASLPEARSLGAPNAHTCTDAPPIRTQPPPPPATYHG